jgi:hypothetical protein
MTDVQQPALEPASTSSTTDNEVAQINGGDMEVERIISEKLLRGFTLLSGACPVCSTPLIKNEKEKKTQDQASLQHSEYNKFPIIVSSESFDQPFHPVKGVPFCVICHAHVVTNEGDVDALERSESFKEKGSILVALQDEDNTEERDAPEPSSHDKSGCKPPRSIPRIPLAKHHPQQEHAKRGNVNGDASMVSFELHAAVGTKPLGMTQGLPRVDPNRFATALFCGTTASRQMVTPSPTTVEEDEMADATTVDQSAGKGESFADALEEIEEDDDGKKNYSHDVETPHIDSEEEPFEFKDAQDIEHCSFVRAVESADLAAYEGSLITEEEEKYDNDDIANLDNQDPDDMMAEYSVRYVSFVSCLLQSLFH